MIIDGINMQSGPFKELCQPRPTPLLHLHKYMRSCQSQDELRSIVQMHYMQYSSVYFAQNSLNIAICYSIKKIVHLNIESHCCFSLVKGWSQKYWMESEILPRIV